MFSKSDSTRRSFIKGNEKIIAFLTSQAITLFGSSLVQYALMWHITRETKDGWMVTLSALCMFIPQILVSLFAGVWADRYNRKLLIILSDAGIAVATVVLLIINQSGITNYTPIFIIMALRALGGGIQQPAVSALVPQLVPENRLMRVNSVNGTIQSFVMLLSPAVGGAVLSMGSIQSILMIDIVTAAIGIGVLLMIKIPTHERTASTDGEGMRKELMTGVRFVKTSFFVKRLLMYYLVTSLLIVPASFFNVLFVTRLYSDSYLYLTLNEMAFFIGSIAGGLALAAWGGFKNRLNTLAIGCVIFGLTTAAMGLVPAFWLYLVFMVIAGVTMPTFNTPVMVLLQEKVPGDMMGRVFSLLSIASSVVFMLASMMFGPLCNLVPMENIMLASGLLLCMLAGTFIVDKRFMAEGLPKVQEAETEETESPAEVHVESQFGKSNT